MANGDGSGSGGGSGAGDSTSDLVNPQSIPEGGTEATVRRRAARGTDLEPSEIELESERQTGELRTSLTREARLERTAAQSDEYSAEDLRAEGGEVSVRDRALRREAAEGTVYDAEGLRVTDDGSVEPKREPSPEQVDLSLWRPDGPSGDVAWVGPDGQRIETGAEARVTDEDPYAARVDVPDTEGAWRLQVGGETVDQVTVGPVGAARDVSQAELNFGWNGGVITLNEEQGTATAGQSPSAYQQPASVDEDVVAGSGAAEALQAGATPEQLSPTNPISESEGDAIADRLKQQQDAASGNPARRGTEVNQQLRQRVAEGEDFGADDVDIVQTGSGLTARLEASGRQIDPGEATRSARERGVGDDPLDGTDLSDADRGVSFTRSGRGGATVTGGPASEPQRNLRTVDAERGVGVTRGPDGVEVVAPEREQTQASPPQNTDFSVATQAQRDAAAGQGSETGVARVRQRVDSRERFGDADWSAGYGDPDVDEVERFVDETLAGGVEDLTRGADREVQAAQRSSAVEASRYPVGGPSVGVAGSYSPAMLGGELAEDILGFVDDAGRAPGVALEAAETANYVTGDVGGGDSGPGDVPRIYTDPVVGTAAAGISAYTSEPEQTTARAEAVTTTAEAVGRQSVEYARENPQAVATEALAGAAVSGAAGTALRSAGVTSRLGGVPSRAATTPDTDVDADAPETGGSLGETLTAARERAPSVTTRQDADAPALEIDPYLRQQLRDAVPDAGSVARQAGRRSRQAEINAQLQARSAASSARASVRDAAAAIRSAAETPDAPDVGELAYEAGRRSRVAEADAELRAQNTISRTRQQLRETRDSVRDAASVDIERPELPELPDADEVAYEAGRRSRVAEADAEIRALNTISRARLGLRGASERVRGATPSAGLPSGAADTTTADVFGRPRYASVARDEVASAREAVASARETLAEQTPSAPSGASFSQRLPSGAADTTTADVFGRPRYPDMARWEIDSARDSLQAFRESVSDRISAARDTTVRIGPVRPQRIDVGRAEDQPDVDLGPFADEDLSDLPSWAEANDIDVDVDRTPTGDARRVGQTMRAQMRTDQDASASARPRGDRLEEQRGGTELFPGAVAGVEMRAADPVTGATNRDDAATGTAIDEDQVAGTEVDVGQGVGVGTETGVGLDTGLGTGLGTGAGLDVGQTPDLGEDIDTGTGVRTTTTPDTDTETPTRFDNTPETTGVPDPDPDFRRTPNVPEVPFDDDDSEEMGAISFDEESDLFSSGIVENPFEAPSESS